MAVLALAVAAISACAPATPPGLDTAAPSGSPAGSPWTTPPAPTDASTGPELLLLAYERDVASLTLVRLSSELVPLPLPDPSVAAVAPIAGGRLVALLRDGRAFVAPRGPAGLVAGTGWETLALDGPDEMPAGVIAWSATSSPDGTRLAAIARPPDRDSPAALVVIEPDRGVRHVLPLADEAEGISPAWIDDERGLVMQRDRLDRLFLALVDITTGRVTDRLPVRALDVGTSRDARTTCILAGERVVVGPTASVLRLRRAPDSGPATPPADLVRGGIALSGDGRLLAVAVEEGDPGPSRIAIYDRAGGTWRAATRITPPVSASGGWLTWLP